MDQRTIEEENPVYFLSVEDTLKLPTRIPLVFDDMHTFVVVEKEGEDSVSSGGFAVVMPSMEVCGL